MLTPSAIIYFKCCQVCNRIWSQLVNFCLLLQYVVVRAHDDIILSHIDKNNQESKMYLFAKFGFSSPDGLRGVRGQTNKQTHRQRFCVLYCDLLI